MEETLKKILTDHGNVLSDRPKLRALLMDYLPQDKQACNLLLMAYDEDIHSQLGQGGKLDRFTLSRYVKNIENNYGVNGELAKKTVLAWTYALNIDVEDEQNAETSANHRQTSGAYAQDGESVWYYVDNSRNSIGPLSVDDIAALLENGTISSDTFVWTVGFDNWVKAGETELSKYTKHSPVVSAKVISVPGSSSDYQITKDANGIVLQRFIGVTKPEIVIPNTINNEPVYAVGNMAFANFAGIQKVVISAGIKYIGDAAFSKCSGLKSVVFSSGLLSIGAQAFVSCSALKSAILPDGLQFIGIDAFRECKALVSVTFPDGVQSIGEHAFLNCKRLIIHCNPRSYAMRYAQENNVAVSISSVQGRAGDYEIEQTSDGIILKKFVGHGSDVFVPQFIDGKHVYKIGDMAFFKRSALTRIVLPNGLQCTGKRAFEGCIALIIITIPDSVQF
ncbi:hypothetical protein FACS1894167_06720 [Synergistales bacterium]|nr:hypothetical protein FACS1894167_06720 [Synergistales bacterium]